MLRPLAALAVFALLALTLAACGGDDGASPSSNAPSATPEVADEDACPSAALNDKAPDDGATHVSMGWEEGEIICWRDIAGEASYRVRGRVEYWIPPSPGRCGESPSPSSPPVALLDMPSPRPGFIQDLAADVTRFQLPRHSDSRMGIRDYSIRIEALDSNGNVIAFGGTSVTRDAFCE